MPFQPGNNHGTGRPRKSELLTILEKFKPEAEQISVTVLRAIQHNDPDQLAQHGIHQMYVTHRLQVIAAGYLLMRGDV